MYEPTECEVKALIKTNSFQSRVIFRARRCSPDSKELVPRIINYDLCRF
jgi:hypothetical protein